MIKVSVVGALGKMGATVVKMVNGDSTLELVSALDRNDDISLELSKNKPDVVVDFTQPSSVFENIKLYQNLKIKSVIGTTGLTSGQLKEIEVLSKNNATGIIIAPNFSIGAILMMRYAKDASKYFDDVEIIELHHNQKKDAPSGTSIKTAQIIGKENIPIHSVRLPGYVASQEVIFGSDGQTLKIRHDTINRECYMSGVKLAINYVFENNTFIYGLENIL